MIFFQIDPFWSPMGFIFIISLSLRHLHLDTKFHQNRLFTLGSSTLHRRTHARTHARTYIHFVKTRFFHFLTYGKCFLGENTRSNFFTKTILSLSLYFVYRRESKNWRL